MGKKRKLPDGYIPLVLRDSYVESDTDSDLDTYTPPTKKPHVYPLPHRLLEQHVAVQASSLAVDPGQRQELPSSSSSSSSSNTSRPTKRKKRYNDSGGNAAIHASCLAVDPGQEVLDKELPSCSRSRSSSSSSSSSRSSSSSNTSRRCNESGGNMLLFMLHWLHYRTPCKSYRTF